MIYYISYFAGAISTLFFNGLRYVRLQKQAGVRTKKAVAQFFLEKTFENGAEWTTTFGVVWAGGAIIINKIDFAPLGALKGVPMHPAFLFLMGGIMEAFAPWLVGKIVKGLFPEQ